MYFSFLSLRENKCEICQGVANQSQQRLVNYQARENFWHALENGDTYTRMLWKFFQSFIDTTELLQIREIMKGFPRSLFCNFKN